MQYHFNVFVVFLLKDKSNIIIIIIIIIQKHVFFKLNLLSCHFPIFQFTKRFSFLNALSLSLSLSLYPSIYLSRSLFHSLSLYLTKNYKRLNIILLISFLFVQFLFKPSPMSKTATIANLLNIFTCFPRIALNHRLTCTFSLFIFQSFIHLIFHSILF